VSAVKTCPQCGSEYELDIKFCPKDGSTLRVPTGGGLEGSVIADRYHVLRKLGEGGMGQVYLAEHIKMGRKSAIKVMNPGMSQDPDAIGRFNREAANASRITHNNVAAIYDFGETPDGLIYLAMEYVEGEPLTKVMERSGALTGERSADITRQVAAALDAAHEMGIVHRDLKPDNIMVAKARDGSDVVKVVDFGIAKAQGGEGQKVTKTGLVVGTPEYMSPEQLAGDQLDGRSDNYTLALVTFNMLTGTLPFPSSTIQESMIMRLTDRPRTLAEMRPDLSWPAPLQVVLDRALQRKVDDRYQKASDFASDLVRTVRGMPAQAAAADATRVVGAAGVSGGAVPATAVRDAAGAAVTGAGTASALPATAANPAPTAAAPSAPIVPAKKSHGGLLVGALAAVALGIGVGAWMYLGRLHAPVSAVSVAAPAASHDTSTAASKGTAPDSTAKSANAAKDTMTLASSAGLPADNKQAVQPYEKPSRPAATVEKDAQKATTHAPPPRPRPRAPQPQSQSAPSSGTSAVSTPVQQPPAQSSSAVISPSMAGGGATASAAADSDFAGELTGDRARLAVKRAADLIKNREPERALAVLGRALKSLPTGNDSVTALYHVSEALLEQSDIRNAPAPKRRACVILGSLRNARGSTYYESINYLFGQYCQ
jgi:serine/threonine-protein kinase